MESDTTPKSAPNCVSICTSSDPNASSSNSSYPNARPIFYWSSEVVSATLLARNSILGADFSDGSDIGPGCSFVEISVSVLVETGTLRRIRESSFFSDMNLSSSGPVKLTILLNMVEEPGWALTWRSTWGFQLQSGTSLLYSF